MSDAATLASARYAWEDGLRRLEPLLAGSADRVRVVEAVHEELRRRVGVTFRLVELSRAYEAAPSWYLELAARVAPGNPDAWEPAVTLDGAFGLYQRLAVDARG
jgi:hypothetical protein